MINGDWGFESVTLWMGFANFSLRNEMDSYLKVAEK